MGQGGGDGEKGTDRAITESLTSEREDLVRADGSTGPAYYLLSEGPGALQSGPDAVADQGALELPNGGHDVEDQLTRWGRGIHVLFDCDEGHIAAAKVLERLDELLHRPRR